MTGAWKRRLVVAGLNVVAVGLMAAYLFAVRPMAKEWELHVRNGIQALGSVSNVGSQKEALDSAFKSYRQQTDLGTALLIGAFLLGTAAVAVGGVWGMMLEGKQPGATAGPSMTGTSPAPPRPA
jgi:hypothetical protein